jgi:pSer/pThr/pTyr-binding forkhead associated (FHA) protein
VQLGNEKRQIVELPTILGPHVVLETTTGKLHVISLANGKVARIGRSRSSDVFIADGAVSRHHATIRMSDGKFLLADDDSELGTHVAVDQQHSISTQIGDDESEEIVSI